MYKEHFYNAGVFKDKFEFGIRTVHTNALRGDACNKSLAFSVVFALGRNHPDQFSFVKFFEFNTLIILKFTLNFSYSYSSIPIRRSSNLDNSCFFMSIFFRVKHQMNSIFFTLLVFLLVKDYQVRFCWGAFFFRRWYNLLWWHKICFLIVAGIGIPFVLRNFFFIESIKVFETILTAWNCGVNYQILFFTGASGEVEYTFLVFIANLLNDPFFATEQQFARLADIHFVTVVLFLD